MSTTLNTRQAVIKFGKVIALSIIILLLLEASARIFVASVNPPQGNNLEFDHKFQIATSDKRTTHPTLLLMGDSIISRDVYADKLAYLLKEAKHPAEVRNLGFGGATAKTQKFLLENYVKKNNKPALVLYNVSPWQFNQRYNQSKESNQSLFERSYFGKCVAKKKRTLQEKLACQIKKESMLVRYRPALKNWLLKSPSMITDPETYRAWSSDSQIMADLQISPSGWSPGYPVYDEALFLEKNRLTPAMIELAHKSLGDFVWDDIDLRELIEYCQKRKIAVALIWLPEHPYREAYHQQFNLESSFFNTKFKALGESYKIPYLNFYHWDSSSPHYYDTCHMNVDGALHFTQHLYQTILNSGLKNALFQEKTQGETH